MCIWTRIVRAGALTVMFGLIGMEVAQKIRRTRIKTHIDLQLDSALEDSMDCSDPVAKF